MYELIKVPMYLDGRPMLPSFRYDMNDNFSYHKEYRSKYILVVNTGDVVTEYFLLGKNPNTPLGSQDLYLIHSVMYVKSSDEYHLASYRLVYPNGCKKYNSEYALPNKSALGLRLIEVINSFVESSDVSDVINNPDTGYNLIASEILDVVNYVENHHNNNIDYASYVYNSIPGDTEYTDEIFMKISDMIVVYFSNEKDEEIQRAVDECIWSADLGEELYFDIDQCQGFVLQEIIQVIIYILTNLYKAHGVNIVDLNSIRTHNFLPHKEMNITGVLTKEQIRRDMYSGALLYKELPMSDILYDNLFNVHNQIKEQITLCLNEPADLRSCDISLLVNGNDLTENHVYINRILDYIDAVISTGINNCMVEWNDKQILGRYSRFQGYNTLLNLQIPLNEVFDTNTYNFLTSCPVVIRDPSMSAMLLLEDDTGMFIYETPTTKLCVFMDLTIHSTKALA